MRYLDWIDQSPVAALPSIALLFLSATMPALAQSPEQLEAFQNMSPDQQRAILDAMGGQGTTGRARTGVRSDRELEFPQTVRQRGERRGDEDDGEYAEEELPGGAGILRVPRLKADDTILLNLEIKEFQDQLRSIDPNRRAEDATAQPRIPGSSNVQVVVPSQQSGSSQSGANPPQADRERIQRTEEAKRRLGES